MRFIKFTVIFLMAFGFFRVGMAERGHGSDTDKVDVMELDLEELMQIVVTTAGKQSEKVCDIPASVVVIRREDIEKYGYRDLPEILEHIPGLYGVHDSFIESMGVRGFWSTLPRNIIVLVNGVKQTFDAYNATILLSLPVEAIDRIEVVRGPMSVMYGTGAFFGVINIIANRVGGQGADNRLSISVGSEKTRKIALRASGEERDFKYAFNSLYSGTNGLDVPLGDFVRDVSVLPLLGLPVDAATGGKLERKNKYFNLSATFRDFSVDASYLESPLGVLAILPPVDEGADLINRALRIKFAYKKSFIEKVDLVGSFCYFSNRLSIDYDLIVPDNYGVQTVQSSGYNAEVNLIWTPADETNLMLGLDYRRVENASSEYTIPVWGLNNYRFILPEGESIVTQALFGQLNHRFSDTLKIVAGIRCEQAPEYTWALKIGSNDMAAPVYSTETTIYSYTKMEFIPRVALIYSPAEDHYLKFLYGQAISRPSFFHQVGSLGPLTKLEPEKINTLELNYIGNISSKFSVNLSLFCNTLDKLIYRSLFVVDGVVIASNANVGKMTTNGVELMVTAFPFDNFKLQVSGTYQDTVDKREKYTNIEPGYSPKFLGYLKASYFINEDISFGLTGKYVDGMESYYDFTQSPAVRIGGKVPGYFLLGANIRVRDIFRKGLYVNFRCSNLFDQEVVYPTTSNNAWADRGTIGHGRTFLLTVGVEF
ncbi:MAG: TonB-dependent receptor [bacterium]|nr:TonB-dependent receptor [bacterium]